MAKEFFKVFLVSFVWYKHAKMHEFCNIQYDLFSMIGIYNSLEFLPLFKIYWNLFN